MSRAKTGTKSDTKSETMTPRERVVRALRGEPVDRVPIDLGSHLSTGISAFAYRDLREHLGLSTDSIWIPDTVQLLAMVDEDVRRRFHVDCILLEPPWPETARWNPRGPYEFSIPADMKPRRDNEGAWIVEKGDATMRMPDGGYFFDGNWISDWGEGSEDERIALYAREAERIHKETPYATNFVGYSRGLGFGAFFGGVYEAVEMIENPDAVRERHERACDSSIGRARKVIDAMGEHIQLVTVCDDMGLQTGPACNPALVEEFTAPYLRRFCSFVHDASDVKVFMHNCGSIRPLIGTLIDCGVDALNPVQISADDMAPHDLKREFGDRITFWGGGCDTQNVLGARSATEVDRHVRELVREFKPGGGFVFNQVHNIMGDVPPENIVAMFDAAYEESFY